MDSPVKSAAVLATTGLLSNALDFLERHKIPDLRSTPRKRLIAWWQFSFSSGEQDLTVSVGIVNDHSEGLIYRISELS